MKIKALIGVVSFISIILVGCSSDIKQVEKEIQAGESYDLMEMIQLSDESYTASILKDNINTKQLGKYDVVFKIDKGSSQVEKTLSFLVIDTKAPEIKLIHSSTYDIDEKFDIKTDIKATDNLDDDISDKIEILSNNVDTSKEGTYSISLKVKDSSGNETSQDIEVNVKDVLSKQDSASIEIIRMLKEVLKNPESLQVHKVTVSNPDGMMWTIKIDYSAENGFGGMNRENLYITDTAISVGLSYTHFDEILQNVYSKIYDNSNEKELNVDKIMRNLEK